MTGKIPLFVICKCFILLKYNSLLFFISEVDFNHAHEIDLGCNVATINAQIEYLLERAAAYIIDATLRGWERQV